ncbi:cyclophilin-like fold protein [Paenibacillus monticola]|nr:cyclophilin-like fold protein [Paenibacillus monticola]
MMIFTLVACSNGNNTTNDISQPQTSNTTEADKNLVRVASDGAQVQTLDPTKASRVLENGTKINMHFGDVIIPGTLNDSITAQDLISKLPYTVHVNRYSHDFCGVMDDPLEFNEEDVHYGWLNGDIDFATDADYFTILFEDEGKKSEQYGYQVNIGKIDSELSVISQLTGSYDVLIELAD